MMRAGMIGVGLLIALLFAAPLPSVPALPHGGMTCTGHVSIEFAPSLGIFDGEGTAWVNVTWAACAYAAPGCFSDSECVCPSGSVEACVGADDDQSDSMLMDYYGNCARAFLDGGAFQVLGGSAVTGAIMFGQDTDVGVGTIDGALVAEGGDPCAMSRGDCQCTMLMLLEFIG